MKLPFIQFGMLFVFAGALNVIVAWACGTMCSIHRHRDLIGRSGDSAAAEWWKHFEDLHRFRHIRGDELIGFGVRVCRLSATTEDKDWTSFQESPSTATLRTVHESGWPLLTLKSTSVFDPHFYWEVNGGISLGWARHREFRLDLVPIWPNFVVNLSFYVIISWLLLVAPRALRGILRRRRGLCPACAYPAGASPVCTECGTALKQKADTQKAETND